VDRPDRLGREAILRRHARRIKLGETVDLADVARRTPGFAGADLANLLNEAALLAARNRLESVGMAELDAALDRVIAGLEKKSRILNPKERRIVAYHEAGHALVAESCAAAEPVARISIVPRGLGALGYMQQQPDERFLLQEDELHDRLAVLLGGRAAEALTFGKFSTGASNDLERATELARRMVCEFGMSRALGPVAFARAQSPFLGQPGSAAAAAEPGGATRNLIEQEVQELLTSAHERAHRILTDKQHLLEAVATDLLERETLDREEFLACLSDETAAAR
jgi:cell division protease FtsH